MLTGVTKVTQLARHQPVCVGHPRAGHTLCHQWVSSVHYRNVTLTLMWQLTPTAGSFDVTLQLTPLNHSNRTQCWCEHMSVCGLLMRTRICGLLMRTRICGGVDWRWGSPPRQPLALPSYGGSHTWRRPGRRGMPVRRRSRTRCQTLA